MKSILLSFLMIVIPVPFLRGQDTTGIENTGGLEKEVIILADKGMDEGMISKEFRDSVVTFVRDSLPSDDPQLRTGILEKIMSEIDSRCDRVKKLNDIQIDTHLIRGLVPGVLPLPEDYVDRATERFRAEMAAASAVKELTTRYLERLKPFYADMPVIVCIARMFLNGGMDTSFKTIPVMNGLYYIPRVGGQPLEFDESVFKDREHFDSDVYKYTRPQMQYDMYEGLHFKATSTPYSGNSLALPGVLPGEYPTLPPAFR